MGNSPPIDLKPSSFFKQDTPPPQWQKTQSQKRCLTSTLAVLALLTVALGWWGAVAGRLVIGSASMLGGLLLAPTAPISAALSTAASIAPTSTLVAVATPTQLLPIAGGLGVVAIAAEEEEWLIYAFYPWLFSVAHIPIFIIVLDLGQT